MREEKVGLEGELQDAREEVELCLVQLSQVQQELEHYFFELQAAKDNHKIILEQCALKDEKLHWLRGQRVLLIGLIKYQASVFQRFTAISVRLARALKLEGDAASTPRPWLLCRLEKIIPGSRNSVKQINGAPLD